MATNARMRSVNQIRIQGIRSAAEGMACVIGSLACSASELEDRRMSPDILSVLATVQGGRSCTGARVAPAENFKPEHKLFCRELRFVAIYALFGDLWAKKSGFLGQKQCFLGKKCTITWYILHISLS